MRSGYPTLRLSAGDAGWECDDVALAAGVVSRLVGMSSRRGRALLMRGDSVHTMWMRRAISVVFVDEHGSVLSTRRALPGLVYRHRGAAWVLEIDGVLPVPPRPGTLLRLFLRN